jgi:uncharacterized protein (TIGR02646 family)
MKLIIKGEEPQELRRWKQENAESPQNLTYRNMPTDQVKHQMLSEQGSLCAYTMQRIEGTEDCHIEHIVPQNQPHQPSNFDINYTNMVTCFPGNKPSPEKKWNPKYPYGANRKGGTRIDENNFVSPLRADVEQRFFYHADGSISAAPDDIAANSSIRILKLDHDQLVELRKAAIEERVFDDDSLTIEGTEALAMSIMEFNVAGRLPEFCLAVSQVAARIARNLREMQR